MSGLDLEVLLGKQLEAIRLAQNINQAALAIEAGVSLRTITRLEKGDGVSLDTLIRVMRALGLEENLVSMLPSPEISPIDRVRNKTQARQRASGPRKGHKKEKASDWAWEQDGSQND